MGNHPLNERPADRQPRPDIKPGWWRLPAAAAVKAILSGIARAATEWLLADLTS